VISSTYIMEKVGMGALVVSTREQLRIHTVSKVSSGKLKFKEA